MTVGRAIRCADPLHDLADLAPEMHRLLQIIQVNADLADDPRMDGLTDCYLVPLDDIDAIGALIGKKRTVTAKELEQE